MKKIIILLIIPFLCACSSKQDKALEEYNSILNDLKNVTKSSICADLTVNMEVEKLSEELYNYRALIDKPSFKITDVTALLYNEENEINPSIGIFDKKETFNKNDKEKGIKLSGYITIPSEDYKLFISYKKEGKLNKCYYVLNNVTYIDSSK